MSDSSVKPVIVGIDGSASAVHAVRWAAAEAHRRNARLRIAYADVLSLVYIPDLPGYPLPEPYVKAAQQQGKEWLHRAADNARVEVEGLDVVTELHVGPASSVLIRLSQEAQLMVVGSRGLGGFTGLVAGSVAVALSAHGHCPVAMVRGPDTALPDAPVVVGVDSPTGNESALTTAFESAASRGVVLRAVHTWNSLDTDAQWWADGQGWDTVQTDQERWLAERLAGWSEKYPDVEVERYVSHDKPAKALLQHAQVAQLVVVGARGRGGFTGLLLGSTSQQLLQNAPCPVVVAR
ncbi:universal stress protein [Saccharopolyspora rhizosphaerae]|uniref:Universal stress protein n=1 Tax=Saccharopolyspora rhizosphaerae TaxID=2492662 RepID=A0A3R8P0I9_9PSEU|nr:universal stress protein [Saccharopolyspora rhizosphaerae]RRO16868.1 universal stress protein [Saccharopolyspora rhizosphaerae]